MTIASVRHALRPEHLEAIGLIAATWAELEAAVSRAIAFYGDLDDIQCGAVTAQLKIVGRLELLEALGTSLHTIELPDIYEIQKLVRSLEGLRNKFLHGQWIKHVNGEPVLIRVRAKGTLVTLSEPTTLADLQVVATKISDATTRVFQILQERASKRKPP